MAPVPLAPSLQAIVDTIMAAYPDGLTLNELSEELSTRPVTYSDIDEIIGALEDAGIDLEAAEPAGRPEDLLRVLTAARTLAAASGARPSAADIARHTGLTVAVVRRALRLGLSALV